MIDLKAMMIGGVLLTLSSMLVASCAQKPLGSMAEEWEAPTPAAGIRNPVAADPASVAAGKTVYQRWCLACHGNMGKGDGRAAIALDPPPSDLSMPMMWEHSDGALFWKITEGRRPMPLFRTLLTDNQRWQAVNYIRTLAARPEGPAMKEKPMDMPATRHMP